VAQYIVKLCNMANTPKNNRPGLSPDLIRAEFAKGRGPQAIADEVGCSRQAVWDMANRYGIHWDAARKTVHENMPWAVPSQFRNESAYRYLLAHARYVETGGEGMRDTELKRVRSFHRRLLRDDSVLEFNPNTGFEYHAREESDDNLCIRLNEYSRPLTPEGEFIWARPLSVP
jgi:hypothetical protein